MATPINGNSMKGLLSGSALGSSSPGGQVVAYYNDFRQELMKLITNLQDPNAPLTLQGKIIPADAKNGAAGQLLINDWMDNEQTTISAMMDALKFMQSIEKTAEGLSNA